VVGNKNSVRFEELGSTAKFGLAVDVWCDTLEGGMHHSNRHLVTTAVTVVVVVYTQTIPCVNSTPHGYFRKWGYPQINPNHPFSQDFTIISYILL
jgi:hypothetical protein